MYRSSSNSLAMVKSSPACSSRKKYPEPSMAELRLKLARVMCNHQQMKLSFNHLKSQIQAGLLEAEDVFASLAVPLTKLVGLKTSQMAEEGRFSTVVIERDVCVESTKQADGRYEEDGYTSEATHAGKELIQKQRLQIMQLIRLLKQIETQVNSSHSDILQTLSEHRASMQRLFHKSMACLAAIHQAGAARPPNETLFVTMKLLRATVERANVAFESVEEGVEDLIYNLSEEMCAPMMEYVKSLKAEMTTGSFLHLLAIVEKMGGEMRSRQLELEQERRKVRVAEEKKVEALSMLKKSEESIQEMKDYLRSIVESRRDCAEYFAPHKVKSVKEDYAQDEGLLWELVKKKRKYQKSDSPFGPTELNCIGFSTYKCQAQRERSQITGRPITRNYARCLTTKTPCLDSRLFFGLSPSVSTQKVLTCKRITP